MKKAIQRGWGEFAKISCFKILRTCLFNTAFYYYYGLPVLVSYGYLYLILCLEVAESFLLQCHQADTLLP